MFGKDQNEHNALQRISYIQADGDELQHIKEKFLNLLVPTCHSVCWFGDLAKTIYLNL